MVCIEDSGLEGGRLNVMYDSTSATLQFRYPANPLSCKSATLQFRYPANPLPYKNPLPLKFRYPIEFHQFNVKNFQLAY